MPHAAADKSKAEEEQQRDHDAPVETRAGTTQPQAAADGGGKTQAIGQEPDEQGLTRRPLGRDIAECDEAAPDDHDRARTTIQLGLLQAPDDRVDIGEARLGGLRVDAHTRHSLKATRRASIAGAACSMSI